MVTQMVKSCLQCGRPGFNPWVRKIPWKRKWQSTPVFLPGKSNDRGAWLGLWQGVKGVSGVSKSQTWLSNFTCISSNNKHELFIIILEIQPVHPKGDQSWVFIGRVDVEAEIQYFGHWWEELTHLKRPRCRERLRAGEEGDNRGWDGWMASPTWWTWL